MVKITKSSLAQLAQEMHVLAGQEQKECIGGVNSTYSQFGSSFKEANVEDFASVQNPLSTQIGETESPYGSTMLFEAEDTYRQHDIFATAFIKEVAPEMKSSPGIGSGASDIGSGGVDDQRISHAFESGFISFDTSMKENPALSYMLMTCIQKIPQLQSLLAGYLNGTAGKLTFKLEELASGIVMETRSDAIGQTTEIIINSFYVDDNGFNYVMTGTSNNAGFNFGNETNADANTTFVGNLTHEAMHARHIAAYNEAMEYAVNSGTLDPFSVARQYLLNKGYSSEFTDIFFIEKNGKWSKTDEKTFDKREHEYIKTYNQGVFNNAMNQWGALY